MDSTEGKKKSRYRYLAGNIALFSVSNFVSKILVFLLVPLYTNVLTTSEYGIADIMQVTLLLLVPALTINIGEAALRFGIDMPEGRSSILRIGLSYVCRADAVVVGLCIMAFAFVGRELKWYILLFAILFAANSLYEFLVLYFQGCEAVPIVVTGSICSTVVMILSNIIFLLVIRIGLNGYIYSQIAAYFAASLVMLLIGRSAGIVKELHNDEKLRTRMLAYSTPLIAYSTASWINNAADRYIATGLETSTPSGTLILHSFEECCKDKRAFAENFHWIETHANMMHPDTIIEPVGNGYVQINPPYPPATQEEMEAALQTAAAGFVLELPKGLDTPCGEVGSGLSEGQAQRVAIARALLHPGTVLILDESTSALDAHTEQQVISNIRERYHGNKTILFISHRKAAGEYADKVVLL